MNRKLLNLLCTTGICVILSLSPEKSFAQTNTADAWNDLGGFGGFGSFPGESSKPQAPKIDLPLPEKPVENGITKSDEDAKKVDSLKVTSPKEINSINLPTGTDDSKSTTALTNLEDDIKIEDVVKKEVKAPKRVVKKGGVKTPVHIKDGNSSSGTAISQKKYIPHEKIKLNSTLSSVMSADEDIEKEIKANQNSRWEFEHKEEPKKFFVENDKSENGNKHLPRLVYQKEYSDLLFAAVTKDDVGAIKTLLINRADINSRLSSNGYSAVMHATKLNNVRTLRYLILKGADLNMQDKEGKTALHLAASESKVELFNILAAAGAKATIKDHSGKTALDYAVPQLKSTFELSVAQTSANKDKGLFELVGYGSTNAVSKILEAGADINARNEKGDTPLITAARNNDLNMVQLLLSKDADPLVRNAKGEDAISIAKRSENYQMAQIIDTVVIKKQLETGESSRIVTRDITSNTKGLKATSASNDHKSSTIKDVMKSMKHEQANKRVPHYPHSEPENILGNVDFNKDPVEQTYYFEDKVVEEDDEKGFFDSIFGSFKGAKNYFSEEDAVSTDNEEKLIHSEKLDSKSEETKLEKHKKTKEVKNKKTSKDLAKSKNAPKEIKKEKVEAIVAAPKQEEPIAAPKAEEAVVAPKLDPIVSAPKQEEPIAAPKVEKAVVDKKIEIIVHNPEVKKAVVAPKKKDLPKSVIKKTIEAKEEKQISQLSDKNPWDSITDLFKTQAENEKVMDMDVSSAPLTEPLDLVSKN